MMRNHLHLCVTGLMRCHLLYGLLLPRPVPSCIGVVNTRILEAVLPHLISYRFIRPRLASLFSSTVPVYSHSLRIILVLESFARAYTYPRYLVL